MMTPLDQNRSERGRLLVRSAALEEAGPIAALVRLAFATQPVALDPPPSALKETEDRILGHLEQRGAGAVADLADMTVGCCLWEPRGDDVYLSRLAVHPACRRQGVARALLEFAKGAGRAGGYARITLSTRLALGGNRALFCAAGFTKVGLAAHAGFDRPTSVMMAYDLSTESGSYKSVYRPISSDHRRL